MKYVLTMLFFAMPSVVFGQGTTILNYTEPVTAGVQSPTMFSLTRSGSTQNEPALYTSNYTINDAGSGQTGYSFYLNHVLTNIVQNAHTSEGDFVNGPTAQSVTLQANVISSAALNSGFSNEPGKGSQHIALWASAQRNLDTSFSPTTSQPYGQIWGQISNLIDRTNLPSSLGGAILNESDAAANNLDDTNSRSLLTFVIGNQNTPGSEVIPVEWKDTIAIQSPVPTDADHGVSKTMIQLAGGYSQAAIDLRYAVHASTTVAVGLTSNSTTLQVTNVLPFTSTGTNYAPVSASNPVSVLVGTAGNSYSCIGFTVTGPGAAGTLTFSTAVSTADGAVNAPVVTVSQNAIWLPYNQAISWDSAGAHTTYGDYSTNSVYFSGGNYRVGSPTQYMNLASNGIQVGGSSSNYGIGIYTKGTAPIYLGQAGASTLTIFVPSGTFANGISMSGATAGTPPTIVANGSDTNVWLSLSGHGAGGILLNGPVKTTAFTSNGSVATTLSSLGPTGSHTTVQEWLTVVDSGGTTRYIPAF